MTTPVQHSLFGSPELSQEVESFVLTVLRGASRPSAGEFVARLEREVGVEARWDLHTVLRQLVDDKRLTRADRDYLRALIADGSLDQALRGDGGPSREIVSTIDELLSEGLAYRSSAAFKEMVEFMGRFRDYAPYNNMLVRIQNPSCSFYATERDWRSRFGRSVKEDARPMLILAPMHPVMLVYELEETEGQNLPEEVRNFARFEGPWRSEWLSRLVANAQGHRIRVEFKALSSTYGGFATLDRPTDEWKMRIVVHEGLDGPSRLGVLCHELAHILLGHLGTDWDHWWPGRASLNRRAVEIEAESVAYIVTTRLGLEGTSAAYVSRHLEDRRAPAGASVEMIAKVAGHIERMASETMPPRRPRKQPDRKL